MEGCTHSGALSCLVNSFETISQGMKMQYQESKGVSYGELVIPNKIKLLNCCLAKAVRSDLVAEAQT